MKPTFLAYGTAAVFIAFLGVMLASCDRQNSADADAALPKTAQHSTGAPLAAGRFAQTAAVGVDSLLDGNSPSPATQDLFKVYDNAAHTYVRNPGCIAAGLDMTCVSVANSADADGTGGNRGCVTMVTPLHGVTNNHFSQPYQNGVTHYFADRTNTVYTRRVVKSAQVGETDIQVVTFDEPLPASIQPAQLLPAGAAFRLLPIGTPLLATNQRKQAIITELVTVTRTDILVRSALAPHRQAWTASPPAIIGDSDSPTFVLLDHRPRLIFTYHTNVSGPSLSAYLDGINALLSRGYSLDIARIE